MSEWITSPLGSLAAPGRSVISGPFGSSIGKRFFQDAGVPVIRGNNITIDSRKFVDDGFVFIAEEKADELNSDAVAGDFIFTAAGTIGQVGVIPSNAKYARYVISNKQLRFRANADKINLDYLYYWLASPWIFKAIAERDTGSTVPLINLGIIKSLPVSRPKDLETQKKIAAVLSALDAKIDCNNRINAQLEALAKTLYDYWFVQFDFPDANGRPYKSSGGQMVWNPVLKRDIPENWAAGSLDDIGEVVGGSTPSRSSDANFAQGGNGTAWITPNDLSNNQGNKYISHGEWDVTTTGARSASLSIYPAGTVLLSSRAPIGYMAIARQELTTNQGFKSFIPNKSFSTAFIFYTIQSLLPTIVQNASGSTFKEISGTVLKSIATILPDKKLVDDFSARVRPLLDKQNALEQENQQLAQLRDWLLPMLMNGQVTVA